MSRIIRRILVIIPALAIEFFWIFALLTWLRPWAAAISTFLSILAVLFVFYLLMKQDEDTYKILWLIIILFSPVIGALLYLLFGNKRTTRPLRKALEKNPLMPVENDSSVLEKLEKDNPRMAQTFRYIEGLAGLPSYLNSSVKYYPLGDDMFPDMIEDIRKAEHFIFLEYFIIEEGEMWNSMSELLAQKA